MKYSLTGVLAGIMIVVAAVAVCDAWAADCGVQGANKCCFPAHHKPPADTGGCDTPCDVSASCVTSLVRCGQVAQAQCKPKPNYTCSIGHLTGGSMQPQNWKCTKVSCTLPGGASGFQCKFRPNGGTCGAIVPEPCVCSGTPGFCPEYDPVENPPAQE
jgi:hypothetical protein